MHRKIYLKRLLSVLVLMALILAGIVGIGHLITPVSNVDYFRHDLEKINRSGKPVDMIIVGASRAMYGYIPSVFEEQLGMTNVINASSSSQPFSGTYYRLKQLLDQYSPQAVILDVDAMTLVKSGEDLQANLVAYDLLSLPNRIMAFADTIQPENWIYGLNIYRHRDHIREIFKLIRDRKKLAETDYAPNMSKGVRYQDNGFVFYRKSCPTGSIPISSAVSFNADNVNQKTIAYLDQCMAMCAEKGIRVIIASPPTSMVRVYANENLQGAFDYLAEYAADHHAEFYPLSLLKDREDFLPDEMMWDRNHVNGEGAKIVSERFCQILREAWRGEDVSGWFYRNVDELKADTRRVVGMTGKVKANEAGELTITMKSLHNDNVTPVYRVEALDRDDNMTEVLSDWDTESERTISKGTFEKVRVLAALSPDDPAPAWQICNID